MKSSLQLFLILIISGIIFSCANREISKDIKHETVQSTEIEEDFVEEEELEKEVIIKNYNQDNEVMKNCRLQMTMELSYRETSKDSHTRKQTVSICDCNVEMFYGVTGRFFDESELIIKLNEEKEQQIIDYLIKNGLNVSVEEQQKTDGIGIAGTLILNVTSPFVAHINIKGKTNIWGSDDYVKKEWGKEYVESRTNLKNSHYFSKADSFLYFLKNL